MKLWQAQNDECNGGWRGVTDIDVRQREITPAQPRTLLSDVHGSPSRRIEEACCSDPQRRLKTERLKHIARKRRSRSNMRVKA